jgi:hypothetical protein
MIFKQLAVRLLVGVLLATLPLALCFAIAEIMVRVGVDLAAPGPVRAQQRRNIAGIVLIVGFVMSGVSWFGLVMYAFAKLMEIGPRARHERRLQAMRDRGEIDF